MDNFLEKNRTTLRVFLIVVLGVILVAPASAFFTNRGGLEFLSGSDLKTFYSLVFPLVGLYGFTLIWLQIMIGSNMRYLVRVWPRFLTYHQYEGVVTFIVVATHVLLVVQSFTLEKVINLKHLPQISFFTFLPEELRLFGLFGSLAFDLLIISTSAALLRKTKFLRKHWRIFHYLNYLIFFLVFFHSWNLGSDTQSTPLRYFWAFAFLTVTLSLCLKILQRFNHSSN